MTMYGYIRVSTKEQNESRQFDAMKQMGISGKNLFIDKHTGTSFYRPAYERLMEKITCNDLIVIASIDRLGRNYEEILIQWQRITKEIRADIQVLDMPLLNTLRDKDLLGNLISDITLQLLSFVAEKEQENIKHRQAEGIASAKARGVKFGRPEASLPDGFEKVEILWLQNKISAEDAAAMCNISKSTFYRKVNRKGNRKTRKDHPNDDQK